jgi:hypothetical protein
LCHTSEGADDQYEKNKEIHSLRNLKDEFYRSQRLHLKEDKGNWTENYTITLYILSQVKYFGV